MENRDIRRALLGDHEAAQRKWRVSEQWGSVNGRTIPQKF